MFDHRALYEIQLSLLVDFLMVVQWHVKEFLELYSPDFIRGALFVWSVYFKCTYTSTVLIYCLTKETLQQKIKVVLFKQ